LKKLESQYANLSQNQNNGNQPMNRSRPFRVSDDDYDRDIRQHKDSDDWTNIRGSMADTDVRGKNAIESRIREEDTDEFVSLSEDKIQKKSFLSKIIKSIEDDNKEVMNNKDKEVRTGVKKNWIRG
jgi:hypothetical protein